MTQVTSSVQTCIAKIIQHNPILKRIFDQIYQKGGRVLLVGGAVRDCLLKKFNADLDFEVYHLSFDGLAQILKEFGVVSFVGKSFGVLRLHGIDADWSIPRKDSSGRKPVVDLDPDMSFDQAFKRRDLTVNAMGIDVNTFELIDPFDGLQDLQNNILRSPDLDFFVQDPLRLFRVMQFSARLQMEPDDALNNVCRQMDITDVSSERIEAEFKKLFLKSVSPSIGFRWLDKVKRLYEVLPGITFDDQLYKALDCCAKRSLSKEITLAALWGCIGYKLEKISDQKNVAVRQIEKEEKSLLQTFFKKYIHASRVRHDAVMISWYLRYIPLLVTNNKGSDYCWLAYWLKGACSLKELSDIGACWYTKEIVQDFEYQAMQAGVLLEPQQPLLTGKDLLSYAQGKDLGDLITQAYVLQLNQAITQKELLLKHLLDSNDL